MKLSENSGTKTHYAHYPVFYRSGSNPLISAERDNFLHIVIQNESKRVRDMD
jgi:hypothetical protein